MSTKACSFRLSTMLSRLDRARHGRSIMAGEMGRPSPETIGVARQFPSGPQLVAPWVARRAAGMDKLAAARIAAVS